jgi:hypothetical protein
MSSFGTTCRIFLNNYQSPKTIFYDYCSTRNRYATEIKLPFSNVQFQRPFFVKNSGISHVVTPAMCNRRGIYYGADMFVDIRVEIVQHFPSSPSSKHRRKKGDDDKQPLPLPLPLPPPHEGEGEGEGEGE